MAKKRILIAVGGLLVLLAACGHRGKGKPEPEQTGDVTALRFTYDMFSGDPFYLSAYVKFQPSGGASAEVEKRVGPMNAEGQKKEGDLSLSAARADALLQILGRYDLAAWSKLPTGSAASAPSRSLMVFSGEETLYDVRWNARFPKTLPPQEDIMYAELFNFFNGLIAETPGWEDVRSDDLDDPRDDPAYGERTVTWFGQEVKLVPGTGQGYDDGRYAEIDYAGKSWWVEEGFVGHWTLDASEPTDGGNAPKTAELTVSADGSALFTLDGAEWPGKTAAVRRYRDSAGLLLARDGDRRNCAVELGGAESYARIHLVCYPGPVPEAQFEPIDVYLLKTDD